MSEPILTVANMNKKFGSTVALNDVSLTVYPGEIRGLIGENGSGKSTVTSIVAGMQECDSGAMTFQGQSWKPLSMIDALHKGIGMIVQESGTIPGITVAENIFLAESEKEDIKKLIVRAVQDEKKGMGSFHAQIDEDALEFLADVANGDARSALNAVELGILTTAKSEDGKVHITLDTAQECIQKRVIRYDKTGDNHYDTISAFIKSMRGSDPDATAYYLARMLYAGEDVRFIARRILICASEDVGNADPQALVVASAAAQAVERLGMPEARITLSQAALYVACAPKSNAAYMAVDKAMEVVKTQKTAPIPAHLQDAHYKSAAKLGHGAGYLYAHDYKNHYVRQQYLPDALKDSRFYEMTEIGYEKKMKEHLDKIKAEADSE